MSDIFEVPRRGERGEEEGMDPQLRRLLGALDPSATDSSYWTRFERSVLSRAGGELARRRAMAQLTVSDLVSSWARAVVPTALLAAAAAGLMLVDLPGGPALEQGAEAMVGVEEVLADGEGRETIPAILADESLPGAGGALFAAEIF